MSKTKFINVKQDFVSTDLSVKESLVLSYLASLTKKEYCYASTDHLEEACGIKRRTIFSILNSLEEKKLIMRVTKSTGHYGKDRRIYVSPRVKIAYHSI